ncbi:hypothetical protein [Mycobacterium intracellulare]|uniref:hypothetical protein n=1 Tax=Mycobacterium intracellulare TaxID=1767 RepID=UPI001EED01B4|nr:hypothetical protein [Mycobacterium intracellulare]MEE3755242.1 hypothetical protein [Mycobacterium intracellulare]
MSADTNGIRFLEFAHPGTGRPITRLEYRGWFVDVDATVGGITVPPQVLTTQHTDDFAPCLDAARAYARKRAPVMRRQAPTPTSGLPPAVAPSAPMLAAILTEARTLAADRWQVCGRDIYECTRSAWESVCMDVPYTTVLHALRRALVTHPATSLTAVNDQARGRADIVAFCGRAIAALRQSEPVEGAA